MLRRRWVAALLCALTVLVPLRPSAAQARPHRSETAMWVWHWTSPTALIATAKAHGITRLLIWVSPGFETDTAMLVRLAAVRHAASAAAMEVDALGGDPSWVDHPGVAVSWARAVRKSALFSRIHVDVEPHARPDWLSRRAVLSTDLVSMLTRLRAVGLPLDADIPSWYATVSTSTGNNLAAQVLAQVDSITIMAYADTARAVLGAAAAELSLAAHAGRPAWIGINTAPARADPPSTSYWDVPLSRFRTDVAVVRRTAAASPEFAGLALHDSESLADMDRRSHG
jgi:hypothetical protein